MPITNPERDELIVARARAAAASYRALARRLFAAATVLDGVENCYSAVPAIGIGEFNQAVDDAIMLRAAVEFYRE